MERSEKHRDVNISIQKDICNGCSNCVSTCPVSVFTLQNLKSEVIASNLSACTDCERCVMSCPTGAILIEHLFLALDYPKSLNKSVILRDFKSLLHRVQEHKGVFKFKDTSIDQFKVKQILDTIQDAPIGLPPSKVHVLVVNNPKQVDAFMHGMSVVLRDGYMIKKFLKLNKSYGGTAITEILYGREHSLFDINFEDFAWKKRRFSLNAPLLMCFYGLTDIEHGGVVNASAYAMAVGEYLGLGTCILVCSSTLGLNRRRESMFNNKWGVDFWSDKGGGVVVLFGYRDDVC